MSAKTTVQKETMKARSKYGASHGAAMKAIVQEGYGAPEQVLKLEEVDRPAVGDHDVLIRLGATSAAAKAQSAAG